MQDTNEKIFCIDDKYDFLTKEFLEKEYCENHLTDHQIATKYNIGSKATVWRRRKFFGISNANQNKSNNNASINRRFSIPIEEAKSCLAQGLTYEAIADRIGCSRMVAYRRMKEMGLISDQKSTMKKLKWHESLSDLQYRFFIGCLLGDGSITRRGMFQCNHSDKQEEYIDYKLDIIRSLVAPDFKKIYTDIFNHQNGKTYHGYYIRTMQNENLKKIYDEYYIDKIKIFPYEYLLKSKFDEYSLAIWYMDDGSRSNNTANLYTYGFGYDGNLKALSFLKEKFGIEGEIKKDDSEHRSEDCKHYISIKSDANKFFNLISPYVLPYFNYKLPNGNG